MPYSNLKIFLKGFRSLKHLGFSTESIFNRLLEFNEGFNIEALKEELIYTVETKNFTWVDLAIETKFVDPPNKSQERISVDNLIIYTDAAEWRHNFPDGQPTYKDREKLKDQFKTIDIHSFSDIHQIIDSKNFSWLPFEIKRSFKLQFGEMCYTNDDIIYEIKKEVWEYLFPFKLNNEMLMDLSFESNLQLKKYELDNGWMDMDDLVFILSKSFPSVDLFVLTKVKWENNIQKLNHFRNPIAMGFKRHSNHQKL